MDQFMELLESFLAGNERQKSSYEIFFSLASFETDSHASRGSI